MNPLWDGIERLINEHGSANILRERLALARDQHEALEKTHSELKGEVERLRIVNGKLQEQLRDLERRLSGAQAGNPSATVCDHCGSTRLKRTGNRPDPTFGDLGIKQAVFICLDCSRESAFTPDRR